MSAQTLVFIIALGLSKYFTASILAAVSLCTVHACVPCRGVDVRDQRCKYWMVLLARNAAAC